MKKVIIIFITVMIFISTMTFEASANKKLSKYESLDAYLQNVVEDAHIPGMAITVVNKDEILYSNTYGNCNSESQQFIIGSLSKSFTAVAIMQLVEQGKINLEDSIAKYLKEADSNIDVTVKQLLNQNSGMGAYQPQSDLTFSKKKSFVYANSNYGLLGQIIENVSGMDYEEYINKNIFKPLNMKHSYVDYSKAEKDNIIAGYRNYFGLMLKQKYRYPEKDSRSVWSIPAGYIISSAEDMGKYLQMYLNKGKSILSTESINSMFNESVPVSEGLNYGMGWEIDNRYEKLVYKHSGLTENYMSYMFILPESETAVIMLIDSNDYFVANLMMSYVNHNVISMMLGNETVKSIPINYVKRHLLIDAAMIIFILLCSLPLIRIKKWCKKINKDNKTRKIIFTLIFNAILPIILLILPKILGVSLAIVFSFVPDVGVILVTGITILFITGCLKLKYILKK